MIPQAARDHFHKHSSLARPISVCRLPGSVQILPVQVAGWAQAGLSVLVEHLVPVELLVQAEHWAPVELLARAERWEPVGLLELAELEAVAEIGSWMCAQLHAVGFHCPALRLVLSAQILRFSTCSASVAAIHWGFAARLCRQELRIHYCFAAPVLQQALPGSQPAGAVVFAQASE